jgi:hypothetical protein
MRAQPRAAPGGQRRSSRRPAVHRASGGKIGCFDKNQHPRRTSRPPVPPAAALLRSGVTKGAFDSICAQMVSVATRYAHTYSPQWSRERSDIHQ